MSRVDLRHHFEFLVFRVVSGVLLILPERIAMAVSAILGWLAREALRIRRVDVDRHLAMAFPRSEHPWRVRVARRSYCHIVREAAMTLRLSKMSSEEVMRRTTMEGFESLRRAVEQGQGVVLISGHLGSWEIGGAALAARGIPMDVIAHPQRNPFLERYLGETRERLGLSVILKNEAFRLVPKSLAAGRTVTFVADQNLQRRGVFVDFFGHLTATARGPALFALRRNTPVFFGFALRLPGWPSRYRVTLERIPLPRASPIKEAVRELTQQHVSMLENSVRETPGQYFWHHRRWKTRPDSEPF